MRLLSLLALPTIVLVGSLAGAQERSADDLFQEAAQLFARGEIQSACDKFGASYKLDASPKTLFNLAVCHERDNRLWLAREEFLDFADRAVKVRKPEAAQPALEHLNVIESKLPKLQLVFSPRSNVASILVDGAVLPPEAWRKPIPVDPDKPEHSVEFRAPKAVSDSRKAAGGAAGTLTSVDVPMLAKEGGGEGPVEAPAPLPVTEEVTVHPHRTLGLVAAGAGVALLAVGGVFGGLTIGKADAAQKVCPGSGNQCPTTPTNTTNLDTARGDWQTGQNFGLVSDIALGVGVAAVAVGAYLVFAGSHAEASAAASPGVHVLPMMGRDGGGAMLSGAF